MHTPHVHGFIVASHSGHARFPFSRPLSKWEKELGERLLRRDAQKNWVRRRKKAVEEDLSIMQSKQGTRYRDLVEILDGLKAIEDKLERFKFSPLSFEGSEVHTLYLVGEYYPRAREFPDPY